MNDGDWNNAGQSVLGMQLTTADDEVLVWFNRHAEDVTAQLPEGGWEVGLLSDAGAEAPIDRRQHRSAAALGGGAGPRADPGGQAARSAAAERAAGVRRPTSRTACRPRRPPEQSRRRPRRRRPRRRRRCRRRRARS